MLFNTRHIKRLGKHHAVESNDITNPEGVVKKKRTVLFFVGLVASIAIVVSGLYIAYEKTFAQAYLIQGVPYWGLYVGTNLANPATADAYSILTYWGDGRFTPNQISKLHPSWRKSQMATQILLRDFLIKNGYDVRVLPTQEINELIPYIKENTPLVLVQRMGTDTPEFLVTSRLLIGYDNKNKILIFHDYLFGNNYEITYENYESLLDNNNGALIVTPGEALKAEIKGPDPSLEYPKRLTIMDSPEQRDIAIKVAMVSYLNNLYKTTGVQTGLRIVQLLEDILASEGFKNLHPVARISMSVDLARMYTNELGEHERAVSILINTTLPLLDYDLYEPFEEWGRDGSLVYSSSWRIAPWEILGTAYLRLGEKKKARESFEQALKIDPTNEGIKKLLKNTSS